VLGWWERGGCHKKTEGGIKGTQRAITGLMSKKERSRGAVRWRAGTKGQGVMFQKTTGLGKRQKALHKVHPTRRKRGNQQHKARKVTNEG